MVPEGYVVELESIPGGPEYFDEMQHFSQALDAAPRFYATLGTTDYRVAIAAGAIDPGLPMLRAASPIPVVGPGEASLFLASTSKRSLGLVTVDEHAVVKAQAFIEQTVTKPTITGIRSIDFPVRQLMDNPDEGDRRLREQCRLTVEEDGAEAVYLACLPFGKLPCAATLADELGVPVYNPWLIAVATAVEVARALPA
jgi:allantoin racemase